MNDHPYLRAYLAGICVPTFFLMVAFLVFCTARFGCNVNLPIERYVAFPLALVPNLWGVWNIVYVARHGRFWLPLGWHGALLPLILMLSGFFIARLADVPMPGSLPLFVVACLPVAVIVYFLFWKHLVGFLNGMLGIA